MVRVDKRVGWVESKVWPIWVDEVRLIFLGRIKFSQFQGDCCRVKFQQYYLHESIVFFKYFYENPRKNLLLKPNKMNTLGLNIFWFNHFNDSINYFPERNKLFVSENKFKKSIYLLSFEVFWSKVASLYVFVLTLKSNNSKTKYDEINIKVQSWEKFLLFKLLI